MSNGTPTAICGGRTSASADATAFVMWVGTIAAIIGAGLGFVSALGDLPSVLEKLDEILNSVGSAFDSVFQSWFQRILAEVFTIVSTDPADVGLVIVSAIAGVVATVVLLVLFWTNRCFPQPGRNATSSGVAEAVTPAFSSFWNIVFPFTAVHPQIDVVVRMEYWEQTQWGGPTLFRCADCQNCPSEIRNLQPVNGCSPMLAFFIHSNRVCSAGIGAVVGGIIAGATVGWFFGALAGISVTGACALAAPLCVFLSILAAIIVAAGITLLGGIIGGVIGRYSVSNDEEPTAPGPGDSTAVVTPGDYLTASGNLLSSGFVGGANCYWFVGYGMNEAGSVVDMRTAQDPKIMKHGRSKQVLPPWCYTDPQSHPF